MSRGYISGGRYWPVSTPSGLISFCSCELSSGTTPHEALKTTPAKALGVADRIWAIGELLEAALATQSITPVPSAPERR